MSRYDNVVIFGVEQMMEQLEAKLEQEMKEGGVVVACRWDSSPLIWRVTPRLTRFKFPTWTPVAEVGEGVDTVWRYQR